MSGIRVTGGGTEGAIQHHMGGLTGRRLASGPWAVVVQISRHRSVINLLQKQIN